MELFLPTKKPSEYEKSPEIPPQILKEIKSQALNGKIESCRFSIDGIRYVLRFCLQVDPETGENNGDYPAEYFEQPDAGEYVIYIWEDIIEKFQRVLIFHEITEIYFREKFDMEALSAHNATLLYEEQVRKELFSEEEEEIWQEMKFYYKDRATQAFVEDIVDKKMLAIIERHTNPTGKGGQEIKDEQNLRLLAQALKELIEECEIEARTEFKDADPTSIKQDAKKVVMRKALMYLSEHADMRRLQKILSLSTETNAKIQNVLVDASLTEM